MLFVGMHKWHGVFLYKRTNATKIKEFFKKAVTNTRRITLTKQKLLLGAKNWRYIVYVAKPFLIYYMVGAILKRGSCNELFR